jgi:phosphohistidine phosphatase
MKVVLIRHAAAVPRGTPGVLDNERPLTSSGKVKFRAAARGLARIMPTPNVLLTSPRARAQETAEIAAQAFKNIEPGIERALAEENVDDILSALKSHPLDSTVALVGHEPTLGAVLARMLGSGQAERLAFKKGGVAVVDLPEGPATPGRLIWFLDPHILRTLANRPGIASGLRKDP